MIKVQQFIATWRKFEKKETVYKKKLELFAVCINKHQIVGLKHTLQQIWRF